MNWKGDPFEKLVDDDAHIKEHTSNIHKITFAKTLIVLRRSAEL